MTIQFEINDLPQLPNKNMYSHWRTRHREAQKWKKLSSDHAWQAIGLLSGRPVLPLKKAKLTLIRCTSKKPDEDGLTFSFKHVVDGLVQGGILMDDSPSVIGKPKTLWQKAKPRQGKIIVKVESLEEESA